MSVEDLIAKDAVYHSTYLSCHSSKLNLKAKSSSYSATIQSPYDIAFYHLLEEIYNDLMYKMALLYPSCYKDIKSYFLRCQNCRLAE